MRMYLYAIYDEQFLVIGHLTLKISRDNDEILQKPCDVYQIGVARLIGNRCLLE